MAFDINHDDNAEAKVALMKRLNALGVEGVRATLAVDGFPMGSHAAVQGWLSDQAAKAKAPKT